MTHNTSIPARVEPQPTVNAMLRTPQPDDYAVIASWVPDAHACIRWAGPRVPFPFAAAELQQLLSVAQGESHCLGEAGAAPFGFGQHFVVEPGAVHLGRIIVSPAARGKGLGRELCRQLISRALQATGAGTVTLRVYRDNPAALRLYVSLGFVPVEPRSTEDVLFMALQPADGFEHGALHSTP
jgi:[ribosomal protein S18]-alanine N-acetyltransferase